MNRNKLRTTALLAALTIGVLAQPAQAQGTTMPAAANESHLDPAALEWLDRARARAGITADLKLVGLRTAAQMTVFGPNGAVAGVASIETLDDLPGSRSISRMRIGETVAQATLITPEAVQEWNPAAGVTKMPASLATERREDRLKGINVLLLDGSAITHARVLGAKKIGGRDGTAIDVHIGDAKSTLLLAADGTVLADSATVAQLGTVESTYGDYAAYGSLQWPSKASLLLSGTKIAEVEYRTVGVEGAVDDAEFALP